MLASAFLGSYSGLSPPDPWVLLEALPPPSTWGFFKLLPTLLVSFRVVSLRVLAVASVT